MNNANTLHPGQILNEQFLIPKQISINTFATQTGITGAYVQFRGSEFHTRNAQFRQLQEQRRAKAQR